jgi:SOS response regulatory protein OraA/RecX
LTGVPPSSVPSTGVPVPADPDPIEIAARALEHRDRSRRQLEERLERAGVDARGRAEALETLERVGYVDDGRYAVTRAAALAERGYGDDGIRHLLEQDGVPAEAAAEALAALPLERERAAAVVARLGPGPKTAAHLARKGFGEDAIESAHAEVGGEDS